MTEYFLSILSTGCWTINQFKERRKFKSRILPDEKSIQTLERAENRRERKKKVRAYARNDIKRAYPKSAVTQKPFERIETRKSLYAYVKNGYHNYYKRKNCRGFHNKSFGNSYFFIRFTFKTKSVSHSRQK